MNKKQRRAELAEKRAMEVAEKTSIVITAQPFRKGTRSTGRRLTFHLVAASGVNTVCGTAPSAQWVTFRKDVRATSRRVCLPCVLGSAREYGNTEIVTSDEIVTDFNLANA